jgi:hypothetical protein
MGRNFDRGKSNGYCGVAARSAAVKYGVEKRNHRRNFTQFMLARNFKAAYAKLLRSGCTARGFAKHTCAFIMATAAFIIVIVAAATRMATVFAVVGIGKRQLRSTATMRANEHVNMRTRRPANNQQAEGNNGHMFYNAKHN